MIVACIENGCFIAQYWRTECWAQAKTTAVAQMSPPGHGLGSNPYVQEINEILRQQYYPQTWSLACRSLQGSRKSGDSGN